MPFKIFFRLGVLLTTLFFFILAHALAADKDLATTTSITAELQLLMPEQEAKQLFFQYRLEAEGENGQLINQSAIAPIRGLITKIAFSVLNIDEKKNYKLFVHVYSDSQGKDEIASKVLPVLTQGNPKQVFISIKPLKVPIE